MLQDQQRDRARRAAPTSSGDSSTNRRAGQNFPVHIPTENAVMRVRGPRPARREIFESRVPAPANNRVRGSTTSICLGIPFAVIKGASSSSDLSLTKAETGWRHFTGQGRQIHLFAALSANGTLTALQHECSICRVVHVYGMLLETPVLTGRETNVYGLAVF